MKKPFSFFLVTDTHYFDNSFKRTGSAYEERSITDQKCVAETPAIIDACFAQLEADTETKVILIPGDLVYRGEYQSHIGIRERLYKLKDSGKKIYLITARHDYGGDPVEFDGDNYIPVEGMPREQLREFYIDFGFGDAISEHLESMSYVAQISDGVRLLALNCDGDCKDFKGLSDSQMSWALDEIKKAHESGNYIFAMTHYPLIPFSPVMNFIGDAKLTDWEKRANEFADARLDVIFTGHMHAQAVTDYKTVNGNVITDIQTGSVVGCPCAYRKVALNEEEMVVQSLTVKDFDYDKGGKTAEEYFRWRFERMINHTFDSALPSPAKKLLDKLTVKSLANILLFKVDKEIGSRLVRNVAIEFVINIFLGNEPYVEGTALYEAMETLLKRLHPITHIVEKKFGEKYPQLADVDTFVLSMIGDKNQRDHDATIKIKTYSLQNSIQ